MRSGPESLSRRDRFSFKNAKFAVAGRIAIATIALSGGMLEGCKTSDNKPESPFTVTAPTDVPEFARKEIADLLSDVLLRDTIPPVVDTYVENFPNSNGWNFYGTGWQADDGEFFVTTIGYDQNSAILFRQIRIHAHQITKPLDPSGSSELTSKYFKPEIQHKFNCIDIPGSPVKSVFCEDFLSHKDGSNSGVDVTSPLYGLQETQVLY